MHPLRESLVPDLLLSHQTRRMRIQKDALSFLPPFSIYFPYKRWISFSSKDMQLLRLPIRMQATVCCLQVTAVLIWSVYKQLSSSCLCGPSKSLVPNTEPEKQLWRRKCKVSLGLLIPSFQAMPSPRPVFSFIAHRCQHHPAVGKVQTATSCGTCTCTVTTVHVCVCARACMCVFPLGHLVDLESWAMHLRAPRTYNISFLNSPIYSTSLN